MDTFTRQYIATALWSSTDDSDKPLDAKYGVSDLHPTTLIVMRVDCAKFQADHADDISADVEGAGHDFWLTRNGHGAGFWDGDWADDVGERLTRASKAYGEVSLYVGDDGRIYSM